VGGGETEIVSSGGTISGTLLASSQETVQRPACSTIILSGCYELVSIGGKAVATHAAPGTLEVVSAGTASGIVFPSGGTLLLDSGAHPSGTISGFRLGEAIDLRGLAFSSSNSTPSWTQKTSGANASGTLIVREGARTQSFTLVGSYWSGNFSATSDGHGGTLVTDPPITSGGSSVATSSGTGSGSEGIAVAGSGTTLHSGGYELGGATGEAGGPASGVFFSGGGMMQLESLLSELAGFISGFDLGDKVGPTAWDLVRHPAPCPGCERPPDPMLTHRAPKGQGTSSTSPCSGNMRPISAPAPTAMAEP